MKVSCIGGGPGGLYSAILIKARFPAAEVEVFERQKPGETFGFGVVFSDATLDKLAAADAETYADIRAHFAHWDDIDIHRAGLSGAAEVWTSTGHGFCGFSRQTLLDILQRRCRELGVKLHFEHQVDSLEAFAEADLIVAADGINSPIRERFKEHFQPDLDHRPNYFIWLGTTKALDAFTFYFKENDAGLWRVHAYQYEQNHATFIIECTPRTFARCGLAIDDEKATIAYLEQLFAEQLEGHRLIGNRSFWRQFPTVRCGKWSHRNIVLLGDAVHTAHFSIGSGTKLAMEDSIALVDALAAEADIPTALEAYEGAWRPEVESLQRAAQVSLEWFENVERYYGRFTGLQFAFSLLSRSLRVSHANLRLRDPSFVERVDRDFASRAHAAIDLAPPDENQPPPPPMFTPFKLRDLVLENRVVVSPMCQYSASDGTVDDWHLVHLGSRAVGGAGLVMTEMTAISASARISPGCAGLYQASQVAAWRRVTDFVHQHSAAKIGIQIGHAGRKGSTQVPWQQADAPLAEGNWPLLAPSAIAYREPNQVPREMTRQDLDAVLADHVQATELAVEADFDILELHMAHGYLLSSFLSPLTNLRRDEFGGSIEQRMKYPLEVFAAVRRAWPEDKPISVRISATDWLAGGQSAADSVAVARALHLAGCDLVDVSTGQVVAEQEPDYGRLYQTPYAEQIRLEVGIPTLAVGNISTAEDANSVLAGGRADLIAIARAHLWDPYWTRHAAHREKQALAWPDPYATMNQYTPRKP